MQPHSGCDRTFGMFTRLLCLGLICLALPAQSATLFPTNSTWRFLRGTNEASLPNTAAWRNAGFNDAAFADAPSPFWYGDVRPGGTQLPDMLNTYTCVFLRKTATVNNAAQIGGLQLTYYIDDGFILWINGVEIYRENITGDPTTATLAANQATDPAPLTTLTVAVPPGVLLEGNNQIAVQVFNTTAGSSDLGFDLALDTIVSETVPPTIISFTPAAGPRTNLTEITVTFSEPVNGVSSDDLVVAGLGAASVTGGPSTYTFTFPQPLYGPVPISWESSHGITDQALPPNPFDANAPGATWSYTLLDVVPPTLVNRFPQPGATVSALREIEITFSENVTGVSADALLINGQPATTVTARPGFIYQFGFNQPPNGPVQIGFAPGHHITDPAANPFTAVSWTLTLDTNAVAGDLVITEINASNQNGLLDEDGEAHDWIEIHNRGVVAANLNGWSLSDDDELPGQWIFPDKILQPGEYLVVFASGKDRKTPTGLNRYHANFTLAIDGEFVGLYNSESPRKLISGFSPKYPVQRNDYSYGYDAAGQPRYFVPTPGGPNGNSTITGIVAPVHFSTTRGHYTQPFDLVLTCPTPGATIRYTTDGSEPTAVNGRPYTGALRLTNTTLLRASAFRVGQLVSKVTTHSFFFGLTAADRSLPTLSIVTHSNNITGRTGIIGMSGGTGPPSNPWTATGPNDYYNPTNKGIDWERPVSVEYINPADNSGFQIDAGMRVHGSDWTRPRYQATSKFSYRLYFRGDYGFGRLDYPLMPTGVINSFDQIVLRAGHNDETNPFLTDELMRQLYADTGQVGIHGTFVNFWLNGVAKRYYNPTERVDEGFLQSWHGGGKNWDVITVGSEAQGGDNIAWNSLRNYVNSQNAQIPAVFEEIARRMDMTNFVDYLIVNTYGATWDWPHNNWRAARERAVTGRFRFYMWDAEGGFGFTRSTPTFDSFSTTDSGLLPPSGTAEIPRLYQGLRVSPEFRLLWADRVHKHFFNNGPLTDTNITKRFLELREKVLPVIAGFNNAYLNTWIPQRRAPLLAQYNTYGLMASSNAPAFSKHGGAVPLGFSLTITNLSGTIYYTLDGSDPRVMFSGAVSNSAIAYAGPVVLNQSVLIKARSLSGTNWSAVTEATFEVGALGTPLRITEINYNPAGGSVHEFIELQNISGAPVNLSGYYFDEGITYLFSAGASIAAGARIVLANNTDTNAFALRYPGVNVAGYFSGNLNNAGERLTLRDASGNLLLTVDYRDSGGWPAAADGAGATLELISALGDPDDGANWSASAQAGGTPGASPTPPVASPVRLNEILAENAGAVNHNGTFPDYVELQNTGGAPVNLAGWSLTDDGNARKFVFPSVEIPGGGYLVVWCDATTNTTPGLHTGFTLQRGGDDVYLYNAATSRVDAVAFGLQLTNAPVGRIAGEWVLNMPTPGADNAAAPLASASNLSINEWLASAPAGQSDWIELHNPAAQPVALRGCYLSNTSSVHRITSLSFVPPFGFVQLFADEGVGPDHLDFKLAAAGGTIVLSDPATIEINRVSYTNAVEGLTRGRLPDGGANLVNFSGSASPGASNYVNTYTGPVINEVLARNRSAVTNLGNAADYLELLNPNAVPFSLAGMSLSVNSPEPGQYVFPVGASIPANGLLVIWCDGSREAAFLDNTRNNTGRSLDGESGGVYLFNSLGQLVNSVEYGFQIIDRPIGLSGGQWRLLASATPGAANAAPATLATNSFLRINEWMANPASGADWFELFNATNLPVDLGGLYLTDDPSNAGQLQFRVAPLSFIGPAGFVQWIADGNASQGRNHVNFSLSNEGESLWLFRSTNGTNFTLIDTAAFDTQALGVSEGRLPDGSANIVAFPGSATPSESNYLPVPGVVINEILTHTDPPLEDAVELRNSDAGAVNIGGWYLSDSQEDFKKFRIPDGTTITAGGFIVFYESQFGAAFTFDSAHGDEAWLSAADAAGNLTGYRTGAKFGAAENGVSFGRVTTTLGVDYAALSTRSLGSANTGPLIGPLVINEIMYNPTNGTEEYIELRNVSATPVQWARVDAQFPAVTNTWKLVDGVEFSFPISSPQASTIDPGAYVLIVGFDPAEATALAAFRARYNIPVEVRIFGPFTGRLGNEGDDLNLLKPDATQPPGAPDAGFVPYVLVDKVNYNDKAPWPSGAVDGGGLSLQRQGGSSHGNEPLNWRASAPTPGTANGTGVVPAPTIVSSPASLDVIEGNPASLSVTASSTAPIAYQWRFNGTALPGATNAAYALDYVVLDNDGAYDCIVSNPGGTALSATALMNVRAPVVILFPPASITNRAGSNITFTVAARGSAPLRYQWRLNGVALAGETNATLLRGNIQIPDEGQYDVVVSNPVNSVLATAQLVVLVNPAITIPPSTPITVVTSSFFTVSITVSGNPLPFNFEWRRGSIPVLTYDVNSRTSFATLQAPTNIVTGQSYRVIVRNLANTNTSANSQFFVTTVVDSDVDGLPDFWETAYGLDLNNSTDRDADADGDGMTNYEEYLADTNPTNALSRLSANLTASTNSASISFEARSNKTYSVQYSPTPAGSWSTLGDVVGRTNNRVEVLLDPGNNTNRFYRVITPRQ